MSSAAATTTGIHNRLVGCIDTIAEIVVAEELPEVFDQVQFGRVRR
jgi:hypothetical protein